MISARHVVLATGYELAPIVPPRGHRVLSTWAIATRPQPGRLWPREALIWEASDPYLYLRATRDGRVICGGEDEDFTDEEARDALIGAKTAAISASSRASCPGSTRPRIRLGRRLRLDGERPADHPATAAPAAHPRDPRLWRQRHHLLAHRRRDHGDELDGSDDRDAPLFANAGR